MSSFKVEAWIGVTCGQLWSLLADFGNVSVWNPHVESSALTSEETGVGATRRCDFASGEYAEERILEWDEGKCIVIEMYDTDMTHKKVSVEFSARSDGMGTIVVMKTRYTPNGGFFGLIGDTVHGKRQFKKSMEEVLYGLKGYAETHRTVSQAA